MTNGVSQVALDAVAERDRRIPPSLRLTASFLANYPAGSNVRSTAEASGLLSAKEMEITALTSDATAVHISLRKLCLVRSPDTTLQLSGSAAITHQLLSCLTDFFFEEALVRAKDLDDYYERTGELVGPLHGQLIIVSMPAMHCSRLSPKDHMDVLGHKSGCGFSADTIFTPASKHGSMAQLLYDAGAVFYCKTNLPQSIMHLETYSFWGQVVNPYNNKLTAGGSSGGCSALVAFGGSPLSVGSDIGGSLRSPAAACGLWTLKPTTHRVPRDAASPEPSDSIAESWGPICRRSVVFGCHRVKAMACEHDLVPIPWQISTPTKWSGTDGRIRLGVMWHDGVVLPQPPIRRALKALVDALTKNSA
ncbi:amidase signature domain-containing protein, partial [Mycena leptocephala]